MEKVWEIDPAYQEMMLRQNKPRARPKHRQWWRKKRECFICDGFHRIDECPKKEFLNALLRDDNNFSQEEPPLEEGSGEK